MKRMKLKRTWVILVIGIFLMASFDATHIIKAKNESIESKKHDYITVLLYHHLLEDKDIVGENSAIMSVENFKAHMDYLHNEGYHTLSLKELEQYLYEGKSLPDKSVVITFDDGYLSNIIYGYPILKAYGMKASIFPTTINIEEVPQAFNTKALPRISYKDIVLTGDVFEYGSHTHAMHDMEEGVADLLRQDYDRIYKDLTMAQHLTGSTPYFAYPFGAYNQETICILKELGYTLAFTTKPGKVRRNTNPMEINRYPMYPSTTVEKLAKILNRKW